MGEPMGDSMAEGPALRARLPEPREPGRYRVAFVCTGNICRSPSAEVVLRSMLADPALIDPTVASRVEVDSGGMRSWHVGRPMDDRSAQHLHDAGYDPYTVRAEQVDVTWLQTYDVVLAMDRGHLDELATLGDGPVLLFREFDPVGTGEDTPDPYYGGDSGFSEVLQMVERTCRQLVLQIARALQVGP